MAPALDRQRHIPQRRNTSASAWWSVGRFGLCVLLLSVLLSLLVLPWVHLSWWRVFRRCVSIAAALSLWLSIRVFERRTVRSYGFSAIRAGKRQLVFGLCLGVGALLILGGLGLLSGVCQVEVTPDRLRLWRTLLGFLPAAVLISLLEELVFRGFLLQHLLTVSRPLAIGLSSALYAIVHVKHPALTLETWLEVGGLFLLGSVLAQSYLLTRQLYLAIGLHAALAYGARVNKLLMTFDDSSRSWLVGTSRLVNGLIGWIAILGIGGVIWWWTRAVREGGARHGCRQA